MRIEKYKWYFLRFLLEAKAYKAFIDNVEANDNPFRGKYGVESLKCLFDGFSQENWIEYGFQWSRTKEGDSFWRKLHFKWQENVDDLKKL